MLIGFSVSNFLSFCEMQKLSMISGRTRKNERHVQKDGNKLGLLRFSALFGANSSGKSNLLKAILYAQTTILKGIQLSSNSYCRIYSKNKEKVSTFDFEMKIDDKYYAYGFDILLYKNSIKSEWLLEITGNKEKTIFYRELDKDININDEYFENEELLNRLKIYADDIKNQDNILFLTVMNKNKDSLYSKENNSIIILKKVFDWFKYKLTVILPHVRIIKDSYYASEEGLEKITKIISSFDTGISKCKTRKVEMEELMIKIPKQILDDVKNFTENNFINMLKNNVKNPKTNSFLRIDRELYIFQKEEVESLEVKTVEFEHENNEGKYSFYEESDGTIRILDLIEILINTTTDKVYFIDELDRCLHPKLTCNFVKTFLEKKDKANVQLFVTTHESRLLNFDLLRRDEIWFANRCENKPTELYSLEEYNERFDKKIDKAYLEGRYGGVPVFKKEFNEEEYENT